MKKAKLRKKFNPCAWLDGCPMEEMECGKCDADTVGGMTRKEAKEWWKNRLKVYKKTGE